MNRYYGSTLERKNKW